MSRYLDRPLPNYTRGEEIFNMVSHIVGGGMGVVVLAACVIRAAVHGNVMGIVTSAIYGVSMILLYTMSSIYHGLKPGIAKKVLRVLDHCTIYFLIAGTYTPIALCGLTRVSPAIGWVIFGIEWGFTALAVTLTAVDLNKYRIFSMAAYIVMGWCIIVFYPTALKALGELGFMLIFIGGVLYTIGSVLYGLGSKRRYIHSVFHLFVLLGSLTQALGIFLSVI